MRLIMPLMVIVLVGGCAEKSIKDEDVALPIEVASELNLENGSDTIVSQNSKRDEERREIPDRKESFGGVLGALIGGIVGPNAFDSNYEPVSLALAEKKSPEEILSTVEKLFKSKGYGVTRNDVFLMLTTDPKDLGYQEWPRKHEKWKIRYSLKIQLIRSRKSSLYWDLSFKIVGERSGHEDREFTPSDFELTKGIFEEINKAVVNILSKSA